MWRASLAKDHSDPRTTYLASIAKAYASQIAVSNADKCVQIFGGAVSRTWEFESMFRSTEYSGRVFLRV